MAVDNTKMLSVVDVVYALVGEIKPIGDSVVDAKRFANLEEMTTVVDALLMDIRQVAELKDHHAYSIARAGNYAHEFVEE